MTVMWVRATAQVFVRRDDLYQSASERRPVRLRRRGSVIFIDRDLTLKMDKAGFDPVVKFFGHGGFLTEMPLGEKHITSDQSVDVWRDA